MAQDERNHNLKSNDGVPERPEAGTRIQTDQKLASELSEEVTDAVRSAVTRVMADQESSTRPSLPDFDLSTLAAQSDAEKKTDAKYPRWPAGLLVFLILASGASYWGYYNSETVLRLLEQSSKEEAQGESPTMAARPAPPTKDEPLSSEESKRAENTLPVTALVALAEGHMKAGRIKTGRSLLRPRVEAGSAEAAFAMAKSYDPNYLSTISNADEQPDAEKAEYWYREWHKKAVEQGLVSKTMNIDRLIRSLVAPSSP